MKEGDEFLFGLGNERVVGDVERMERVVGNLMEFSGCSDGRKFGRVLAVLRRRNPRGLERCHGWRQLDRP